jgi:hypothetical protein
MKPRCAALVSYVGQFTPDQCSNTATKGEFCGIHHPDAVARRKAKSVAYHEKHMAHEAMAHDMKRRQRDRAERIEAQLLATQDLLCDLRGYLALAHRLQLVARIDAHLQSTINVLKEVK